MIKLKPLTNIMDITAHHQSQTDLSVTETKLPKIPKPFSIESLISTCRTDSPIDHSDNADTQTFSQNLPPNFIPNFPIYNPWMGYLTAHTTNERISQLFTNPAEFSHFLEHTEAAVVATAPAQKHPNKLSDLLTDTSATAAAATMAAAAASAHREKLAQYFANNVRDGKFTEFLMNNTTGGSGGIIGSDYSNVAYGSETEQRFVQCSDKMQIQNRNLSAANVCDVQNNFSQLLNRADQSKSPYSHHVQQQHIMERDEDLDSVDTGSELSLSMSLDENQKSAGMCGYLCTFLQLHILGIIICFAIIENRIDCVKNKFSLFSLFYKKIGK